ncbi:MAG: T9SS type A sorting domain-containing protein [Dysgonamonadaceae bacterium]|jgi:hypothetical protein|nr:T9SS type A sorting domain-containing protein [Dysgonamonadaceae bacterium]
MKKICFLIIAVWLCNLQINAGDLITNKNPDLDSTVTKYNGDFSDKDVYVRDGDIVSGFEYYYWNTQTNDWGRSQKMTYSYEGGLPTQLTVFSWIREQNAYNEEPSWKTECNYDEQGKKLYEASYDWDDLLKDWKSEPYNRSEYQYDDVGKVVFTYSPDAANPSSKTEYQYDDKGYLIKEISYEWSESFNDWARYVEHIYHNDPQGKCISYESYRGQIIKYVVGAITIDINYWGLYHLHAYEYDALGRVKRHAYDFIIYEAISSTKVVDTGRRNTYSNTYYYRNNASIGELESNDVAVYPNPVTESFRINGINAPTEIIITDLSGRIVLQQTINAGEYVAAGNLPKGVYIVSVDGKTLKVVKQ